MHKHIWKSSQLLLVLEQLRQIVGDALCVIGLLTHPHHRGINCDAGVDVGINFDARIGSRGFSLCAFRALCVD